MSEKSYRASAFSSPGTFANDQSGENEFILPSIISDNRNSPLPYVDQQSAKKRRPYDIQKNQMRANSVLEAASDEEMSPHALKQKKKDCFHDSILSDFEQTVSMEKINKSPSKMKLP